MVSVDEALSLVLSHTSPLPPVEVPVVESVGLVLAEDVVSDIDSPPHDKALVDGFAVRVADLTDGPTDLTVLEQVTAGQIPTQSVTPGTATQVMTGVPVPQGADAVVMVEYTLPSGQNRVRIDNHQLIGGANIMPTATSLRRGETVLRAGSVIRPIEVGLMSEVGRTRVLAAPRPRIAILATGNELVTVDQFPQPGNIRNSNGPMLCALAAQDGGEPVELGIATDDQNSLSQLISRGLACDVLVLSGGVSAGVLDLVPQVFAAMGIQEVFHKVQLKPGKPLWFGTHSDSAAGTLVFGLPGNPVSSLVCFELFVRPAIVMLSGKSADGLQRTRASLVRDFVQRSDRPTYYPSVLHQGDEPTGSSVEPLDWQGSADLRSLTHANCLAFFPPGPRTYATGEPIEVLVL